ncbi:MAG: hypothetical protein RLW61_02030 [Gammaproteobacteria bacterium]|jgi:hypothetical protein
MNRWFVVLAMLLAGGGLLCVAQLWFAPFAAEIFFKLLVTLAIAVVVIGAIALMRRELGHEDSLRRRDYLD